MINYIFFYILVSIFNVELNITLSKNAMYSEEGI